MADKQTFDPVAVWQEMLGRWERQVNDFAGQVSGNEMFAGPLNQVAKATMLARKSLDGTMEQLASGMMIATQPQMQTVIERLDRIEEQLATIAARLSAESAPSAPAPRRTKMPPALPE